MNKHIIDCNKSILDAISQINGLSPEPLVLFIKDEANCIIGALTDGDIRRALIAGKSLQERVEKAMHRDFYFLKDGLNDNVKQIKELKRKKIKLVPILDNNRHIVAEAVNAEVFHECRTVCFQVEDCIQLVTAVPQLDKQVLYGVFGICPGLFLLQ